MGRRWIAIELGATLLIVLLAVAIGSAGEYSLGLVVGSLAVVGLVLGFLELERRRGIAIGKMAQKQRLQGKSIARVLQVMESERRECREELHSLSREISTLGDKPLRGPESENLIVTSSLPPSLLEAATPKRSVKRRAVPGPAPVSIPPITGTEKEKWIAARQKGDHFQASDTELANGEGVFSPSEIPVAMIADDFTFNSFRDVFRVQRLHPDSWRKQMDSSKPALFFCESSWQGGSPDTRPWQAKIYASVRWPEENRTTLLEILDYCAKNSIPTLFWNKEDPVHFGDRINDFIRTASLFDYVLTTAAECVKDYRNLAGALNVGVLPFGVEPRLFNPIGRTDIVNGAVFAGTWYSNYPERCAVTEKMMDRVLANGLELAIFDRMSANRAQRYRFPDRFLDYVHPAIPFRATADVFKRYKYGLTLNTVTDSRSMFARRAFELAASGAVVLSNTSAGVKDFFGDSVVYLDEEPDPLASVTCTEYSEKQVAAMKVALRNTYKFRGQEVLDFVGIQYRREVGSYGVFVLVADAIELDDAIQWWRSNKAEMEHLTICIRPGVDDIFLYDAMDAQSTDVSVVQYESVMEGLRPTTYLETPSVFVVDSQALMDTEISDVKYVLDCLQFEVGPTAMAKTSSDRYQFSRGSDRTGYGVVAADLPTCLASSDLSVLRV